MSECDRAPDAATYWYEGVCPQTGQPLRLPRTPAVEAIARALMQELAADPRFEQEGKMYGVLLAQTATGERRILKAFSGLLRGEAEVAGWVPSIPGRATVALAEAIALNQLAAMKQELMRLSTLPERSQLAHWQQQQTQELHQLAIQHQHRKQERDRQRQQFVQTLSGCDLEQALASLIHQSQQDGLERRRLKRAQQQAIAELQAIVADADHQMHQLKQQRKTLSRELQTQMHQAAWMTNFAGESLTLTTLLPGGKLPTGTGECCAPKLLHYAATHQMTPIALAEFWWGSAQADKIPGEFYGACRDRCQPLMGFLLSGLRCDSPVAAPSPLPIVFADAWIVGGDKPAGLLTVPGRYGDRQDCVIGRLHAEFGQVYPVHRLDQDTSGLVVVARDRQTHRTLSRQFQQQQVTKIYEAILTGQISATTGLIDLPLSPDRHQPPRQQVDWHQGKPSQTEFQVLHQASDRPRIELRPRTGRTHQLRVHAAAPQGLNAPMLGDRWYGTIPADRLHLHAKTLEFTHPVHGRSHRFHSPVPF